jgi:hypothetical protein
MPRYDFAPPRRRRSPVKMVLLLLLGLLVGFLAYAAFVDTEVPTQRIEQDVTNEVLAK